MKKLILYTILFICSLSGFSQKKHYNYIAYYQAVNEARKLRYDKKFDDALKQYKQAFSQVRFVHYDVNMEAMQQALMLMDYNFAGECYKNLLSQGLDSTYLKNIKIKRVQDFTQSEPYLQVMDIYADLHDAYLTNIDRGYRMIIDSLYNIEHNILKSGRKSREVKGVYYSDSLVLACLLDNLNTRGFPSEVTVGGEYYAKASDIFYRNITAINMPPVTKDTAKFDSDDKIDFERERRKEIDSVKNIADNYLEMLNNAMRAGSYRPEDYAALVDAVAVNFGQAPVYYWYKELPLTITEEEKQAINNRRKDSGLPALESFKKTGKDKFERIY